MKQANLIRVFSLAIVLTGCFLVALSAINSNSAQGDCKKEAAEVRTEPAPMQGEFMIWESLGHTILVNNIKK